MFLRSNRLFASLYTWGANNGSLGYPASAPSSQNIPKLIPDVPNNIKKVVLGQNHSAILTDDGDLYMFGKGNYGQLGFDSEENVVEPTLLGNFKALDLAVADIAVGDYHSVILTTDGEVWTTGYGGKVQGGLLRQLFSTRGGALGHGDDNDKFVPTPVLQLKDTEDIVQIAAGQYHTIALGESGTLYAWGRGQYGVLGNGGNSRQSLPIVNTFFENIRDQEGVRIKKIQACASFSAVLLEDGRAYTWGLNSDGQLGLGQAIGMDMYECEKYPSLVLGDLEGKVVTDIVAGETACMFQTADNEFYTAGLKTWWTPTGKKLPEGEKITSMFTGSKLTGVVTDKKKIYVLRYMFGKKDVTELVELGLWKVNEDFFFELDVQDIGGQHRNHYALLS